MIRVGLVDDQPMVRVGLRMILESEPDIEVCCEAANGVDAIALAGTHQPDVILMDIRMPGMDGLAATAAVLEANPEAKVVILTTFDDDEYLYGALRAGASGFLLKSADGDALVDAVRVVAAGEALLAPEVTRRVIERFASQTPEPAKPAPAAAIQAEDEPHVPSAEAIGELSEGDEVLFAMEEGDKGLQATWVRVGHA